MPKSPFPPRLFEFLSDLAQNNDRKWFEANKKRYERDVREPSLEFIRQFAPHLAKISKHMVASDRKVGGSLMRVYRDTRFSADKTPYKTNVGIQFRHEAGKDVHAPGLYLHIELGSLFLGVGMWHPEKEALAAVRKAIAERPQAWKNASRGNAFRRQWELGGESLKRPPRGYPDDHPYLEDLKRKDHIASCSLEPDRLFSPGLVAWIARRFQTAKPYLTFQAKALGLRI